MHQTTRNPLPDTHPELAIIQWSAFTEYRIANYRLARDGSGRIVRGTCVWSWCDAVVAVAVALVVRAWFEAQVATHSGHAGIPALAAIPPSIFALAVVTLSTLLIWTRCTQVLHESLLVFPTLGVQLETHRGYPVLTSPLFISRHFIPLSALEDVIIHEGFRRWNVRYYLAALQRRNAPVPDSAASDSVIEMHVAFANILPHFPVLHTVYCGVQGTLFPPDIDSGMPTVVGKHL